LIVIDPRANDLAAEADCHLRVRPGTNVPLLNAMAHVIVHEHLTDPSFIAERVADYDAFARFVAEWPPELAAGICGVEVEDIRKAARLYASTPPAMIINGLGVTEHIRGADGVTALVNLALLTGNIGKPGAGVNPLRGQNNVQGAAHMGCDPAALPGGGRLQAGGAAFEHLWQTRVPVHPGLRVMDMVDAAGAGRLNALWLIGYDLALSNPNAGHTRAALGRLELLIVQDLFITETAREFGSVFFPACSSFERTAPS
jgi:formate dehydrogenase major subunit